MLMEHGLKDARIADDLGLYQVLKPEGELVDDVSVDISTELMLDMYRHMVTARIFDRKAITLQRQGRMGTYPPFEGQEAAQIGSAIAMKKEDWMFPTYRDHAAGMTKGQPMSTVLLYWMGRLEGGIGTKELNILPPSVPIATHLLHAVGAAWAAKIQRQSRATIAYFGDGASSEGDCHEALNFAGLHKLPIVFLCQNNGFAISVPFARQSASRTISQRAIAYDIEGIRVDGNDVFAVYQAVSAARARAMAGQGPTLIEAVTFRNGAHTTADDPKRYRDADLTSEWKEHRDPIRRLRLYLERSNLWTDVDEADLLETANAKIDEALAYVKACGDIRPEEMFNHVYAEDPWHLAEQRAEFAREVAKDGVSR